MRVKATESFISFPQKDVCREERRTLNTLATEERSWLSDRLSYSKARVKECKAEKRTGLGS